MTKHESKKVESEYTVNVCQKRQNKSQSLAYCNCTIQLNRQIHYWKWCLIEILSCWERIRKRISASFLAGFSSSSLFLFTLLVRLCLVLFVFVEDNYGSDITKAWTTLPSPSFSSVSLVTSAVSLTQVHPADLDQRQSARRLASKTSALWLENLVYVNDSTLLL